MEVELVHRFIQEVFSHPSLAGAAGIVGRSLAVYLWVVFGLRLLGKRELGQMNIYDLVLVIVIANAVQNAMVGDDTTLVGGLVAAATLLAANRITNYSTLRWAAWGRWLLGEPLVLMEHGRLDRTRMDAEGVSEDELMAAVREHGLEKLEQARRILLEIDGSISVIPKETQPGRRKRRFKALRG